MASDYQHCLMLLQQVLPDKDWDRIFAEWGDFADLDSGDNEPFGLLRLALAKAAKQKAKNNNKAREEMK